jgi:nucleotidyltransferase/DNA polymerase involved in DNA repair
MENELPIRKIIHVDMDAFYASGAIDDRRCSSKNW